MILRKLDKAMASSASVVATAMTDHVQTHLGDASIKILFSA